MKYGFIGYGSMGSMLISKFLENEVLEAKNITVSTRSFDKLTGLKQRFPDIQITRENREVVSSADILFLCVKPFDVFTVLAELGDEMKEKHIVSIAACVTIENIQSYGIKKITKVIPSVTSYVNKGVSLVCHNELVSHDEKENIKRLFDSIGSAIEIKEKDFEIAADLTSCFPGLFCAMLDEYIKNAIKRSDFSYEEAYKMVNGTVSGTVDYLIKTNMQYEELISKVATKGGITEEGVILIKDKMPSVFNSLFDVTLGKHELIKEKIRNR